MGKREKCDSKVRKEDLNGVVVLELQREGLRTPGREAGSLAATVRMTVTMILEPLEQEERSSCGR